MDFLSAALRSPILFAWELPQNLLGLALLSAQQAAGLVEGAEIEGGRMVIRSRAAAVSLGFFVFWSPYSNRWFELDESNRLHEIGHASQSRLLGPLYLPLVGVPSVLRVLVAIARRELTGRRWDGYYRGYPEDWADRLGGVRH